MRFIWKRKLPRRRRLLCFTLLAILIYIFYQIVISFNDENIEFDRQWTCEELKARDRLAELCKDFINGNTGGNLCHDLCTSGELVVQDCLAHKNTTVVFSGTWRRNDIVFKTKRRPHHVEKLEDLLSIGVSDDEPTAGDEKLFKNFVLRVFEHVQNELSFFRLKDILNISEQRVLEVLWHPHPLGELTWADMSSLWFLIQRDEFIKLQLLKEMRHIPRVYGFCGSFYAVEKVETLEEFSFTPFKRPMPWKKRLNAALDFLDLSVEFTKTPLGQLHHCDIQPGNFGVAKDKRVVALDIDSVFATKQMEDFLEQPTCESNKQCDFFDCMSACNTTEHKCSRKILTNNLQIICRDILLSHWGQPGLLQRAPIHAQNKLSPVLSDCASDTMLPWKPGKIERIYRKLKKILSEELKSN